MKKKAIRITPAIIAKYTDLRYAVRNCDFNKSLGERFAHKQPELQAHLENMRESFKQAALGVSSLLQAEIEEIEKRCSVRTITADQVIRFVCDFAIAKGIKGKNFTGFAISVNLNAQQFPKAYKGRPESTWFCALYNGKDWIISGIARGDCTPHRVRIDCASPEMCDMIARRFLTE